MVESKDFGVRVDGTAYLSHGDREAIGKSECKLDKAMNINQDANEISWAIEPFQGDIVETKIGLLFSSPQKETINSLSGWS